MVKELEKIKSDFDEISVLHTCDEEDEEEEVMKKANGKLRQFDPTRLRPAVSNEECRRKSDSDRQPRKVSYLILHKNALKRLLLLFLLSFFSQAFLGNNPERSNLQ